MFLRVGQLASLKQHAGTINRLLLMDKNGEGVFSDTFGDNFIALSEEEQVQALDALKNTVALVRLLMDIPVAGFSEAPARVTIHSKSVEIQNPGSRKEE